MKKILALMIMLLMVLPTISVFTPKVEAQEIVWNTNLTPLPTPSHSHVSIVHIDGRMYVIGGRSSDISQDFMNNVYYGEINPDGTIDSWIETTPLPDGRTQAGVVIWNNFLYVIGGAGPPPPSATERDTVWYAPINSDGTLGSWVQTTSLPYRARGHWTIVWNGRIYVGGGTDGFGWKNEVFYAEINFDGSLGNWISTTSLPLAYGMIAELVHDGRIYLIGGTSTWGGPGLSHSEVYYASINPDGSVGSWSTTTPLPEGRAYAKAVLIGEDIYVTGGVVDEEDTVHDTVYKSAINQDGTIGSWTELEGLPEPRTGHSATALQGRIYVIGGQDAQWTIKDTIYYSSPQLIPATIDIDPDTLNLKSNGAFVTAYIELPEGYNVADIDLLTVKLEDMIPAIIDPKYSFVTDPSEYLVDHDGDGILERMVKFDRAAVIGYVNAIDFSGETGKFKEVTLTMAGVVSGVTFEGSDTVRVIS